MVSGKKTATACPMKYNYWLILDQATEKLLKA